MAVDQQVTRASLINKASVARETRVNIGTVRLYQRRDPNAPFSRGQLREIEIMKVVYRVFGGATLPDDDFGRDVLFEILNQLMLNGASADELRERGRDLLPEIDDDDSLDDMLKKIGIGRKRWADDIARRLGVDYQMRTLLDLRTIGACDMSKAARAKIAAQKEAADKRRKRAKAGAKPQAQSERRRKPWELQGISESTYRRRKRAAKNAANDAVTALLTSYPSSFPSMECCHPETEPPADPRAPGFEREAPADPRTPSRCQAPSSVDQQEREAVVSGMPAVHAAEPTPVSAATRALECARLHLQEVASTVMQSDDPASLQHLIVGATSAFVRARNELEQRQ
jgi:hypothetical protein